MSLTRLSGPPELVVSLSELKAQVRLPVEDTDQDAMLMGHLRAAQDSIDGASGWLGRALTTSQWRLTLDAWPACETILIPLPPCRSVDALSYVDTDGATQSINDFVTYGIGGLHPARLTHAYGGSWRDAIQVDFTAGYGGFNDVPETIRAAVLLMAAGLYDGCSNNDAAIALLMPHRIW
jgi:uncharacterized phiE125 gp8 family phage protein